MDVRADARRRPARDPELRRKQLLLEVECARAALAESTQSSSDLHPPSRHGSGAARSASKDASLRRSGSATAQPQPQTKSDNHHQQWLAQSEERIRILERQLLDLRVANVELKTRLEMASIQLALKADERSEIDELRAEVSRQRLGEAQLLAVSARMDELMHELDAALRFKETYIGLVQQIESATQSGQICVVSKLGCSTTTMEALREEIFKTIQLPGQD